MITLECTPEQLRQTGMVGGPLCGAGSRAICFHMPKSEWCIDFKGKHLKVVRTSDKSLLPFPQKNSQAPTNFGLRRVTEPLFLIPG